MTPAPAAHRLVLVTGPSGAGRSSAIRALEDMGFEAIDNLPLSLLDPEECRDHHEEAGAGGDDESGPQGHLGSFIE